MKKILFVLIAVLMLSGLAMATNTTTVGSSDKVIEITGLDADWIWEDDLASEGTRVLNGKIERIVFYPSAASDRMIIRDNGIDAATVFDSGAVSGADDPRTILYGNPKNIRLVIDITDCTLSNAAAAKVVIILE